MVVRYRCTPRRGLYFIRPDEAHPQSPAAGVVAGAGRGQSRLVPLLRSSDGEVDLGGDRDGAGEDDGAVERRARRRRASRATGAPCTSARTCRTRATSSRWSPASIAHLQERAGDVDAALLRQPGARGRCAAHASATPPKMIELFAERTGRKLSVAALLADHRRRVHLRRHGEHQRHDADRSDAARRARAPRFLVGAADLARAGAPVVRRSPHLPRLVRRAGSTKASPPTSSCIWKEHIAGRDEADYDRLGDTRPTSTRTAHRYRRPIVTNVYHEPIDVFDRHLYEKGGCVLHMLRTELGDARFWKAIRHYVQKHAGGSVETRDLARAVEEATGWNLDRFFEQWVFTAGPSRRSRSRLGGTTTQKMCTLSRSRRRRRSKARRRCFSSAAGALRRRRQRARRDADGVGGGGDVRGAAARQADAGDLSIRATTS